MKTKSLCSPKVVLKTDSKPYVIKHRVLLKRCSRQIQSHAGHGDHGHLIVFIDGAEDDLGGILGDLELGVGDGGPVVQDHYDVLGLRPDCRDVDRSGRRRSSLRSILL